MGLMQGLRLGMGLGLGLGQGLGFVRLRGQVGHFSPKVRAYDIEDRLIGIQNGHGRSSRPVHDVKGLRQKVIETGTKRG
jgi:hypothetical protein